MFRWRHIGLSLFVYVVSALKIFGFTHYVNSELTVEWTCQNNDTQISMYGLLLHWNFTPHNAPNYDGYLITETEATPTIPVSIQSSSWRVIGNQPGTKTKRYSETQNVYFDVPAVLYVWRVENLNQSNESLELVAVLHLDCEGNALPPEDPEDPEDPEEGDCPDFHASLGVINGSDSARTYVATIETNAPSGGYFEVFEVLANSNYTFELTVNSPQKLSDGSCPWYRVRILDEGGNVLVEESNKPESGGPLDWENVLGGLGSANDSLASLDDKFSMANSHLGSIEDNTTAIKNAASSMDAKMTTANSSLANIESNSLAAKDSLSSLDSKATASNSTLASIEAKLGVNNEAVGESVQSLDEIKAILGEVYYIDGIPFTERIEAIADVVSDLPDVVENQTQELVEAIEESTPEEVEGPLEVKEENSDEMLAKLNEWLSTRQTQHDEEMEVLGDIADNENLRKIREMMEAEGEDSDSIYAKVWDAQKAGLIREMGHEADNEGKLAERLSDKMDSVMQLLPPLELPETEYAAIPEPTFSPPTTTFTLGGFEFSMNFFSHALTVASWLRLFITLVTTIGFLIWAFTQMNLSYNFLVTSQPVNTYVSGENAIPFSALVKSKVMVLAIATFLATCPVVFVAIIVTKMGAPEMAYDFFNNSSGSSIVGYGYALVSQFIPIPHLVTLALNRIMFFPLLWAAMWIYSMGVKALGI